MIHQMLEISECLALSDEMDIEHVVCQLIQNFKNTGLTLRFSLKYINSLFSFGGETVS